MAAGETTMSLAKIIAYHTHSILPRVAHKLSCLFICHPQMLGSQDLGAFSYSPALVADHILAL